MCMGDKEIGKDKLSGKKRQVNTYVEAISIGR